MVLLIIAFSLMGMIFWNVKKKDILNPASVFLAYWGIVVLFAYLQLYEMRETSERAYTYIFIGMIFFAIGALLVDELKFSRKSNVFKYNINYVRLNMASMIVIVYSIYRIVLISKLLIRGYSWWSIRLMATSGEGGAGTLKGGTISDVLYSFVVSPLIYLIVPAIFTELFVGKRKVSSMILSFTAMITYSIATVSRSLWAFSIIYIISIVLLYKRKYVVPEKVKKVMKVAPIIIILLCIIINKITIMRNNEADILTNAYAYISGALPLFSIHLEEEISNIRTYGMLTFYGFLNPIFFILNYLHIMPYPKAFLDAKLVKDNLETFISISPHINMNAYATLFYDFYIDFGVIGIAIMSFLFGMVCMKSYKYFQEQNDQRSLVLYLILLQFIIFSVARIYTCYATRALTLVWLPVLFKKQYKKLSSE